MKRWANSSTYISQHRYRKVSHWMRLWVVFHNQSR